MEKLSTYRDQDLGIVHGWVAWSYPALGVVSRVEEVRKGR
jgi:hypothetical protein